MMSAYELQRDENIRQNRQRLEALGLVGSSPARRAAPRRTRPAHGEKTRDQPARAATAARPNYVDAPRPAPQRRTPAAAASDDAAPAAETSADGAPGAAERAEAAAAAVELRAQSSLFVLRRQPSGTAVTVYVAGGSAAVPRTAWLPGNQEVCIFVDEAVGEVGAGASAASAVASSRARGAAAVAATVAAAAPASAASSSAAVLDVVASLDVPWPCHGQLGLWAPHDPPPLPERVLPVPAPSRVAGAGSGMDCPEASRRGIEVRLGARPIEAQPDEMQHHAEHGVWALRWNLAPPLRRGFPRPRPPSPPRRGPLYRRMSLDGV